MDEYRDTGSGAAGGPLAANHAASPFTGGPSGEKPPRFADSFGLVLVLLVVGVFATAITGDHEYGRLSTLILLATTTWLALRASQVERRLLRYAVAIIPAMTLLAIVLASLGSTETARIVTASLTALLVVVAPLAIVRRLATHPVVNVNTFYGAVCVYLLIAMFFATAFALTGLVGHTQFFAQIHAPDKAHSADFIYFSFTTITTTGYGDLTAAASVGRMLAMMEAIFGQLYLITVVALVVQNLGQSRRRKLSEAEPADEAAGTGSAAGDAPGRESAAGDA